MPERLEKLLKRRHVLRRKFTKASSAANFNRQRQRALEAQIRYYDAVIAEMRETMK